MSEQEYGALLSAAQRQIQERDLLDQVRALLARGLELDTMLRTVVEATAQTFGYTHVSIYLLEGDLLVLQHQVGYEHVIQLPAHQPGRQRPRRAHGPAGVARRRAVRPRIHGRHGRHRSEVCVPIRSHESVIGAFNLESTGQMVLGEADLRIALALSEDIGIAVERARLYTALRDSEERFASAFEFASIGVALVSPEGRWLKVNRALCELVGYTAAELATKTFQDITHPDDLDTDLERVRQMLAGEIQTYQMEKRYIHRSGSIVWVLLSVSLVRDSAGCPLYFISQIQDINERKRAELAILRQNAELAALNQLGQALSRLVEPASLLELIHTVIGQVLDNRNLYIALYDEGSGSISFPVYTIDGQHVARPARPFGGGLTEHVIRTKAPLFLPHDVDAGARARGVEPQGRHPACFLAVPLLLGDKVSGVIGIQDYERENAYDQGHLEILTTIASQASVALENARLFAETRRRAEQLQAINDVERVVTTTLDLDLLSAQIAQVLHSKLNLPAVAIGLIDGDELVFKAASGDLVHGGRMIDKRMKVGPYGITGRVAASGETLLVRDVRLDPRFILSKYMPHTCSELAVPLKTQAGIIGVLNIESDQVDAFTPEMVTLVETLASQIAIAIENARLFAETQRLARTDGLTGIPNRRYLFEIGERELSRARRFGHPLAALMLDIDRFKQVNDTHGHAVGDQALRALARCCLKNIRDIDTIGRYGGEEFVVLLVETDGAGAHTPPSGCVPGGAVRDGFPARPRQRDDQRGRGRTRGERRPARAAGPRRPGPLRRQTGRPQPRRTALNPGSSV